MSLKLWTMVNGDLMSKGFMRTELYWQVCGGRQKSTMRLCKMNRARVVEEVRARKARCLLYHSCDTGEL